MVSSVWAELFSVNYWSKYYYDFWIQKHFEIWPFLYYSILIQKLYWQYPVLVILATGLQVHVNTGEV
jgi:hypothetical protein